MKFIFYSLIFALISLSAFAQKDVEAKKILDPISQKYRSYNVIKSDFSFIIENVAESGKNTQNGTLITEPKSNKFRVTLYAQGSTKPDPQQEIINDGKSQWTYNKADKEVQLSTADHSGNNFNPAQIFTLYEHGYKYLYTGEVKQRAHIYQMIDLSPEDAKAQFFKIRLMIDKAKKIIYSALIFDNNGNRYNYILKTFTPNPPITSDTFTFDTKTHPGVEVVDLR